MKKNIIIAIAAVTITMFIISCQKDSVDTNIRSENLSSANDANSLANELVLNGAAAMTQIPLSLTIYNPCCQESIYLTGIIHRVETTNTIHMDSRDISGVGLSSGLVYTVNSHSVRNYVFDPNAYLATLNWSIRMMSENGCGYNVQFVVHVTRDENGEIKASIHSGNFFCLFK